MESTLNQLKIGPHQQPTLTELLEMTKFSGGSILEETEKVDDCPTLEQTYEKVGGKFEFLRNFVCQI